MWNPIDRVRTAVQGAGGVLTCQAHYGPDAEEADDTNYDAGRGPADSIKKLSLARMVVRNITGN